MILINKRDIPVMGGNFIDNKLVFPSISLTPHTTHEGVYHQVDSPHILWIYYKYKDLWYSIDSNKQWLSGSPKQYPNVIHPGITVMVHEKKKLIFFTSCKMGSSLLLNTIVSDDLGYEPPKHAWSNSMDRKRTVIQPVDGIRDKIADPSYKKIYVVREPLSKIVSVCNMLHAGSWLRSSLLSIPLQVDQFASTPDEMIHWIEHILSFGVYDDMHVAAQHTIYKKFTEAYGDELPIDVVIYAKDQREFLREQGIEPVESVALHRNTLSIESFDPEVITRIRQHLAPDEDLINGFSELLWKQKE